MDAKPLLIPSAYPNYATQHDLFGLFQHMLEELLMSRPDDPLTFLQHLLTRPSTTVPKIVIYGPPASGQYTLSKIISRKLRIIHIRPLVLLEEEAKEKLSLLEDASPSEMAQLIKRRLQKDDCKCKGWIIEGYPRTQEQALSLQSEGVLAEHFVHLQASDSVLLERYGGKRIDPITKDVYHVIFDPPTDQRVKERLTEEEGGVEVNMHMKLKAYHRYSEGLLKTYQHVLKSFCTDQPVQDISLSIHSFINTRARTAAPHTPRVVILGPTGAGKSLQASELANKYRLVNVDCKLLLKEILVTDSDIAQQMKPFRDRHMPIPDDMVIQVLINRLSQIDCATRGWVLHGFPLTREQAELLATHGYQPYRVIFLDAPGEVLKERLCLRRIDPFTGERYHLVYKIPPTQEISDRLVIHPKDKEEIVEEQISQYNSFTDELQEYYDDGIHINGEQDPYTVFEEIENFIIHPVPKPFPKNIKS